MQFLHDKMLICEIGPLKINLNYSKQKKSMAAHLGGQIASCGGLAAAAFGQTIMLIDTRYVHSPCLAVSSYVPSLPSAVDAAASASLFSLGFSHVAFSSPALS